MKVYMVLYLNIGIIMSQSLFFSEYIEGSSYNKAIEIFNPTNNEIVLTGYQLWKVTDSEGSWTDEAGIGSYALDLYALSFSDIGSTEMACDQPIMDVENAFLTALNNTGSYDIQNRVLTLYSKTDRTVLLKANKEVTED